ncbi:MAG: ABC transporter permease, partial [Bifidobacteriaceae bacterium]|nr:ABC transporter permease [Bifidobacteriaceae bacterium]
MARVIRRWFLTAVPIVLVVSALTFVLASFVPGDPARTILGTGAPPEQVEALREQLGLDRPLPVQYWDWLTGALRGDFGRSITTWGPVSAELAGRVEVTLSVITLG